MLETIKLDDFLHYHAISDLAWAPTGGRAAFLVHTASLEDNGYRSDLWVYEAGDDSLRQMTWTGDVKSFVWEGDDAVTFPAQRDPGDQAKRARGEEWTAFYTLPLDGGCPRRAFAVGLNATAIGKLDEHVYVLKARRDLEKARRLENLTGPAREAELAALRDERSRFTVFDEYPFWFNGAGITNKTRVGLWRYNSLTDTLAPITEPLFDTEGAAVSPDHGKVVFHGRVFTTVSDYRTGIWVYDYHTGRMDCVLAPGAWRLRQVDWLGDRVVFAGTDMGDFSYSQTPALYTIGPEDGRVERLCPQAMSIGSPVGSDVRYGGGTCFKAEGDRLYLVSGQADSARLIAVERDGTIVPLVEKDGSVDLFDVRGGQVLFTALHDMGLQELYRLEDKGWRQVSRLNGGFVQSHWISRPEEVRFTDPDGFEIHGFVLKPAGFDPEQRYPAILDIHGGPRLSYGAVYYHEMQFWASHGYFVFYANPRGSDARGDEFAYIRGKYGTVEYANLMQFTDQVLARYPQIDPARLGVAGGSYGGFMTNWIIGHTHRFAAAASQRSISNFVSMEGTSDCGRTFLDGHIGAKTDEDLDKVWSQSPLSAAHHCTTPTLFIHAEEDYRCWKVEALQMFTAIRDKGVPARLCLFQGENHELSRAGKPRNRIKRLEEITRWMDRYLGIEG